MKSKRLFLISIGVIFFLMINGFGCNSKDIYIGTYQALDSSGAPPKGKIFLELKENGEGVWKRRNEEVAFSWYIRGDELRINTKDGGTMIGKLKRKGITMLLPGEEEIKFKKLL